MRWSAPLVVGGLAALAYLPTLGNGLCRDDELLVAANPLVATPGLFFELFRTHYWAGTDEVGNLYRPLGLVMIALERWLFEGGPGLHHAVNLVLHALAAGLATAWLASLGMGARAAGIAGAWLALHPTRADAVCEVVQRNEVLAFLGLVWALQADARWRANGRWGDALALGGAVTLGCFAKETAVTVLGLLPLAWWLGPSVSAAGANRRQWLGLAVAGAAVAAYLAVRVGVLGGLGTGFPISHLDNPVAAAPLATRWWSAAGALADYGGLAAWPATLSCDYAFAASVPVAPLGGLRPWLGAALALGCLGALAAGRRRPALALGAGIPLLTLGPFANGLFPMGYLLAERALYLPLLGGAVWLAAALRRADGASPRWRHAAWIVATVAVAVLGIRTMRRTVDWRTQATLYAAATRATPGSARVWFAHGVEEARVGRTAAAQAAYERAVGIWPAYAQAWDNLAGLARRREDFEGAVAYGQRAVAVAGPDFPGAHANLGAVLGRLGRPAEALPLLEEAVRRAPRRGEHHRNLAEALAALGRTDAAVAAFEAALRCDPGDAQALGRLAALRGRR